MNYHGKQFKPVQNSANGEVSEEMIFHYQQEGNVVYCTYRGNEILLGHLMGKVQEDGTIEMVYHQINAQNELRTGKCISTPKLMENGKIRLYETWEWTNGHGGQGSSILEEV